MRGGISIRDARVIRIETASAEVELSASTAAELARRLHVVPAARPAGDSIAESTGATPVTLDDAGKLRVFDELTFWLDDIGNREFPVDARVLFRALATELTTRGLLTSRKSSA